MTAATNHILKLKRKRKNDLLISRRPAKPISATRLSSPLFPPNNLAATENDTQHLLNQQRMHQEFDEILDLFEAEDNLPDENDPVRMYYRSLPYGEARVEKFRKQGLNLP